MFSESESDSDNDYTHIEQRLLNTARFRLNQITKIQDEEIERLYSQLEARNTKLSEFRKNKIAKKIKMNQIRADKINEIKKVKLEFREKKRLEKKNFLQKEEEMKKEYEKKTASIMKEFSTKETKNSEEESEELSQTEMSQISNRIESFVSVYNSKCGINNEGLDAFCNESEAQTKLDKERCLLLTKEISRQKELLNAERLENRRKLSEIKRKQSFNENNFNQNISSNYTEKLSRNSHSYEESKSSSMSELQFSSQSELEKLRKEISAKNQKVKTLKKKIEALQSSAERDIESAKEIQERMKEKMNELKLELAEDINEEIRKEVKKKNKLEDKIAELDLILKKIRGKHLKLQSAVNELDYYVNGRFGEHQRSAYIAAYSQVSKSKSKKTSTLSMDF